MARKTRKDMKNPRWGVSLRVIRRKTYARQLGTQRGLFVPPEVGGMCVNT
jgi:hypothetical protein